MFWKRMNKELHTPHRIAITGGIGSGKSYVCARLQQRGLPVFFCDDEAKRIIRTDAAVHDDLVRLVGPEVYATDGLLCKSVLAAFICASPQQAEKVDAVVHPRVAEVFRAWAGKQATDVVFMECALLFESGFDALVDVSAVVVVDKEVRLQRVMQRDNVSREKALAWMALQMSEEEKQRRADSLLHNTSDEALEADIERLLAMCQKR